MKIKTDILSGFLGAGKTTLIRKLLEEKVFPEKLVIIENEFGEVGIDGAILERSGVEIREINSGCICCSLTGDFKAALMDVVRKLQPERIIIEPSGVGKLSEVLKACEMLQDQGLLQVNIVAVVVDAQKCGMYLANFPEFYENQIRHARTVLLSRTQNLDENELHTVVQTIKRLNAAANIVTTPWAELPAAQIVTAAENGAGAFSSALTVEYRQEYSRAHHDSLCKCGHCRARAKGHSVSAVFEAWSMDTARKFSELSLRQMLNRLDSGTEHGIALRAKGIVQSAAGGWIQFDYVPGEVTIGKAQPQYSGRLCVIGCGLDKEALAQLFQVNS